MTSQNTPRDHRTQARRFAEIERRLKALETAPRAGHTSISSGRLTVGGGDDLIEINSGDGSIAITRSGQPAATLVSFDGGGASLDATDDTEHAFAFTAESSVQSTASAAALLVTALTPGTGTIRAIGGISTNLSQAGANAAAQVALQATSTSDPDNATVQIAADGGVMVTARATDPPAPTPGSIVLYAKGSPARLYYRDSAGGVHGPL